jgi:hypothetical protein
LAGTINHMTAPTLLGPRVRLRAAVPADIDARQHLGWHRDIERNDGHECDTRAITEDEAHASYASIEDRDSDTYWVIEASAQLSSLAAGEPARTRSRSESSWPAKRGISRRGRRP